MTRFLGGRIAATAIGLAFLFAQGQADPSAQTPAASSLLVEGDVLPKNWNPSVYPAGLLQNKIQGNVKVDFVVDAQGALQNLRIEETSDHRFDEAVLNAIKGSTFQAAVEQGRPIAQDVQLNWRFHLPYHPGPFVEFKPLPKTPALEQVTESPTYPAYVLPRQLDGEISCEIEVNPEGNVGKINLRSVTDADFIPAALEAVRNWKFKAATQGSLAVADRKEVPVTFTYEPPVDEPHPTNEINGLTSEDSPFQDAKKSLPQIRALLEPVYPVDLLLAGQGGDAEILFTVTEKGFPADCSIASASQPAFGQALLASVSASVFNPLLRGGHTVATKLRRKYHFAPPADPAANDESPEIRLRRQLRAGVVIPSARGLDKPLRPVWRIAAVYPANLQGGDATAGKAEVEFIIDREGRARVPKVVSATREEFGWAAATAITQWTFDPPTRGGQPTDVRVKVPVAFAPPPS